MNKDEIQNIVSDVEHKTGWKFEPKEIDSILSFTKRKVELNGKGDGYIPILFENELRDFVMRKIVNRLGSANRCVSSSV